MTAGSPSEHDDDLFAPTLTQSESRQLPEGKRPWRLGSQFYVAFFGGPLAVAAIAYVNGKRLGLPSARLAATLAIGAIGFLAVLAVAALFVDPDAGSGPRLLISVAGVVTYLALRALQKDADRRYGMALDDEQAYDSLWGPGLAAALLLGFFSGAALMGVT